MQQITKNNFGINVRILQIIDYYKITRYKLAQETGVSEAVLLNLSKGNNKPSVDIINKILNKYKAIDANWLLTGEGEMLRAPDRGAAAPAQIAQPPPACPLCAEKEKVIAAQQRSIDILERELLHAKALHHDERNQGRHHTGGQKRKAG